MIWIHVYYSKYIIVFGTYNYVHPGIILLFTERKDTLDYIFFLNYLFYYFHL